MSNSGVMSLKIIFILVLFIGFSFIIIEQRLESKNLDYCISSLQKNIETQNLQKREVSIKINYELSRLSSYDYNTLGTPLSRNDIVYVSLPEQASDLSANPSSTKKSTFLNIIDQLTVRFFKNKILLSE